MERIQRVVLGIIGKKKVHNGYAVAAFSQCGEGVDVIAPGVDIYSTVKTDMTKIVVLLWQHHM